MSNTSAYREFTGKSVEEALRLEVAQQRPAEALPPHVVALTDLWMAMEQTEREWLVTLIARVDRGDFALRGEPADWQAPADDPGWQMASDRQRYVELIGATAEDDE